MGQDRIEKENLPISEEVFSCEGLPKLNRPIEVHISGCLPSCVISGAINRAARTLHVVELRIDLSDNLIRPISDDHKSGRVPAALRLSLCYLTVETPRDLMCGTQVPGVPPSPFVGIRVSLRELPFAHVLDKMRKLKVESKRHLDVIPMPEDIVLFDVLTTRPLPSPRAHRIRRLTEDQAAPVPVRDTVKKIDAPLLRTGLDTEVTVSRERLSLSDGKMRLLDRPRRPIRLSCRPRNNYASRRKLVKGFCVRILSGVLFLHNSHQVIE